MAARFRETWGELGIQYDRFIRTTDADHGRCSTCRLPSPWWANLDKARVQ